MRCAVRQAIPADGALASAIPTGEPTTGLSSATVVGPDLGIADAYATAVFVMGIDGLEWIEGQLGYEAYIITHDHTTHWMTGFRMPDHSSKSACS